MPRTLEMPAFFDAHGQQLWSTFMTSREYASVTQRELRALAKAMRRNTRPGMVSDPALTARYHAAWRAADEADDARRIAEREYHAYRRVLFVRTQQRGQRQPASPRIVTSAHD
jgi:hypothetical protein